MLKSRFNVRQTVWIGGGVMLALVVVLFAGGALGYQLGRAEEQKEIEQPRRLIQVPANVDEPSIESGESLQSTPFADNSQGLMVPRPLLSSCDVPFQIETETPRAFIGVQFRDIDAQLAETEELAVQEGARIDAVLSDTPADAAGLQAGDIITAVDGKPVDQEFDLRRRIAAYAPGDTVDLGVMRGKNMLSKPVTLIEYGRMYLTLKFPKDIEVSYAYLGVRFEPIDETLARDESLAVQQGALVREVIAEGPAQAADLQVGDIIIAVDDQTINAENTLETLILAHKPGESVQLAIQRADDVLTLSVKLGRRDGQPLYQLHVPGQDGLSDLPDLDLCPPGNGQG